MQKRNRQALEKDPVADDPHQRAIQLMDGLISEAEKQEQAYYGEVPVSTLAAYGPVKQSEDLIKNLLLWIVVNRLVELKERYQPNPAIDLKKRKTHPSKKDRIEEGVCRNLQKLLLRDKWRMTERDFYRLVQYYINHFKTTDWNDITPVHELIEKGKQVLKIKPASALMRQALESLKVPEEAFVVPANSKRNQKISRLLEPREDFPVDTQDELGRHLTGFYQGLPDSEKKLWKTYWSLCLKEGLKAAPGEKWLMQVKEVLNDISKKKVQQTLLEVLPVCIQRLEDIHANPDFFLLYLNKPNLCILKAMLWTSCPTNGNAEYLKVLEAYILWAFKKKPGVGPISLASATAGLWVLSRLPQCDKSLLILRIKAKFQDSTILKIIDKMLSGSSAE